jgi:hypothetical protein
VGRPQLSPLLSDDVSNFYSFLYLREEMKKETGFQNTKKKDEGDEGSWSPCCWHRPAAAGTGEGRQHGIQARDISEDNATALPAPAAADLDLDVSIVSCVVCLFSRAVHAACVVVRA